MVINEGKTNLMVILGDEKDRETILLGEPRITHIDKYMYLGVFFTADGNIPSSLKEHICDRYKHFNKLIIFLTCNYDAPFSVKKKVFQAAFSTALLYGMESWLNLSLKPMEVLYMKGVRVLLGVKKSTPSDLCLLEADIPPLRSVVDNAQAKFFKKMLEERAQMNDDPFGFVMCLIREEDHVMWDEISRLLSVEDHIKVGMDKLRASVLENSGSKFLTYRELNPDLSAHALYKSTRYHPDNLRISFTRFRLSSHRLKIEVGRWSGKPREDRLCGCGAIQDERHTLVCPSNHTILAKYGYNNTLDFMSLFSNMDNSKLLMLKELVENLEP